MTMNKWIVTLIATLLLVAGCEKKPFYVASIGNGGSLDGPYILGPISVTDVLGGGGGFGYGAVNGYPGKSSSIGRMGVPKHIEGYWAKYEEGDKTTYYRISADIDSELAEQKIRTLRNYYKTFKGKTGSMQVAVERERVKIFYSRFCPSNRTDCSGKEGADPNNWVVDSPIKGLDVVVLFDGLGEASATPFPGSPYE